MAALDVAALGVVARINGVRGQSWQRHVAEAKDAHEQLEHRRGRVVLQNAGPPLAAYRSCQPRCKREQQRSRWQ